jgi:hypothetical protein
LECPLVDLSHYSSYVAGPFASCRIYCCFLYFEGSFFQIGSTEWVEENIADLHSKAVAYLNVDCAVQGAGLFAGSTPQLDKLLVDVTRQVGRVFCSHASVCLGILARNYIFLVHHGSFMYI